MKVKKLFNYFWKIALLIVVSAICLGRMVSNGTDSYRDCREFEYYNFGSGDDSVNLLVSGGIEQIVNTKGDELREIALFLNGVDTMSEGQIDISIKDGNGNVYGSKSYPLGDCADNDWNVFPVDFKGLKAEASYIIEVASEDENVSVVLKNGDYDPEYFGVVRDGNNTYEGALNCGLLYGYNYLTVGSIFQIVADLAILVMLLSLFGFALYNFEKLYAKIGQGETGRGMIAAVCGAVLLFFTINPIAKNVTELKEYSRNIGVGIMQSYDVTRVINNFNLCFVVVIAALVMFYVLFHHMESVLEDRNKQVAEFVSSLNVVFLVNLCIRGLVFYQNTDTKTFHYAGYIFILIYLCAYIYAMTPVGTKVKGELYVQYLISAATLSFAIAACVTGEWRDGRFLLLVQTVMVAMVLIYIRYSPKVLGIGRFVAYAAWLPLIFSVYSELVMVLNQRGIFVAEPKECYVALTLLYLTVAVVMSYLDCKKQIVVSDFRKTVYPALVLGLSAMAVQPLLSDTYIVDFIESSNASILISDFLNFGTIPIVEHYGGHMMTGVWEGIAYGLLTGDKVGAVFTPYVGYYILIIAMLFYWLVKTLINEDAAVLTVLFIPFYGMTEYYGLGLLIAAALVAYSKKQSLLNGFMIWLSFAWVTLYRLDMGFSYLWGIGLVLIAGAVFAKEIKYLKNAIISLIITGVAALGAWVIICAAKSINPVIRLKEFLLLSASNQTWSYDALGDPGVTAFPVMYLFIPVMVACILVYALMSKSFRSSTKSEIWLVLVFLGAAYFGNFSRTVVRHSVYEMKIQVLTWSALLFIAIFVAVKSGKARLMIPVYAVLYISVLVLKTDGVFNEGPVINRAAANVTSMVDSWNVNRFNRSNPDSMTIWQQSATTGERINRIYVDDTAAGRIEGYGYLINSLLEENESFVECMDRTFLYSVLGRKNPLYVSQSPIQISGEFCQEQYIAEIEAARDYCPILLLPVDGQNFRASSLLEGTPHAYKYYKVFEYIYDNFTPVCAYDDIAVWCRNECVDTITQKASQLEGVALIDWGYDGPVVDEAGVTQYQSFLHNYDLMELAGVWGNLDMKNAAANEVLAEGTRNGLLYNFELDEADYDNPAYLGINLQSVKENQTVTIVMGDTSTGAFVEKCKYVLDINSDVKYYMIRLSSDYYWHLGEINAMYVASDDKIYSDSAKVLMGD